MSIEFSFSDEQEAFRTAIRSFLRREVLPHRVEIDENEVFPQASIHQMQKEGYFGVPIPSEWGGQGLGKVEYCILLEEIGKIDASHGAIVGAHTSLGTTPLLYFGTNEQKKRWLVPAARGEKLLAFSLTEADSGSDSGALRMSAEHRGEEFQLTGRKLYVTNGREADTIVMLAATDRQKGSKEGVTAFLVDKGLPGFSVGRCEKKMGLHGTSTAELVLDHVSVGSEHVLGQIGEGFSIAMTALDVGRVALGAASLGAMEAALEDTLRFAHDRMQFGHPLTDFQAIQFKLADIAMHVDALRYLVYQAAAHQDRMGVDPRKWGRLERQKKTREAAMVKCLASEWADAAIDEALQVHGGLGYIRGTPIEQAYRDARISRIFEGTNEIQRLIIARDLLTRGL